LSTPSTSPAAPLCPCCGAPTTRRDAVALEALACNACGHRWKLRALDLGRYYAAQQGRNSAGPELERKLAERARALEPLLRPGSRLLEIGCAEGALGQRLKQRCALFYAGVELSNDAERAARVLDRVYRLEASAVPDADFDAVLSFHVLEHIEDVARELAAWQRLLAPDGRVVIEVPNEAGHPLLQCDAHPEHLHSFTAASLAAALGRAGFQLEQLDRGHFESPLYADSLRAVASRRRDPAQRSAALVRRIASLAGGPFFVWGAGGDFRNCLLPVLGELPVLGVFDENPATHAALGAGVTVGAFDRARLGDRRVLVCSLRFHAEIVARLVAAGVPAQQCFGLAEVLDVR
jgi:SAM-dependent methyltransferase